MAPLGASKTASPIHQNNTCLKHGEEGREPCIDNIGKRKQSVHCARLAMSGGGDSASAGGTERLIFPTMTGLHPGFGPNSFRVTVAGHIIKAPRATCRVDDNSISSCAPTLLACTSNSDCNGVPSQHQTGRASVRLARRRFSIRRSRGDRGENARSTRRSLRGGGRFVSEYLLLLRLRGGIACSRKKGACSYRARDTPRAGDIKWNIVII